MLTLMFGLLGLFALVQGAAAAEELFSNWSLTKRWRDPTNWFGFALILVGVMCAVIGSVVVATVNA